MTKFNHFTTAQMIANYAIIHKVTVDEAIKALNITPSLVDKINAVSIVLKTQ